MTDLVITAAGFVSGGEFGGVTERHRIADSGLGAMRWGQVSAVPFERFGRLDVLCKAAIVAVEMMCLPVLEPNQRREDWAISVGTRHGSAEVDAAFYTTRNQPGGASPLLFSYTLPSTVIGEVAIRHHIMGPNICQMAGAESGALALWEAVSLVDCGEAGACIALCCDSGGRPGAKEPPEAWAFLVETPSGARQAGRRPLAEVGEVSPESRPDDMLSGDGAMRRVFQLVSEDAAPDGRIIVKTPCALRGSSGIVIRNSRRNRGRPC